MKLKRKKKTVSRPFLRTIQKYSDQMHILNYPAPENIVGHESGEASGDFFNISAVRCASEQNGDESGRNSDFRVTLQQMRPW